MDFSIFTKAVNNVFHSQRNAVEKEIKRHRSATSMTSTNRKSATPTSRSASAISVASRDSKLPSSRPHASATASAAATSAATSTTTQSGASSLKEEKKDIGWLKVDPIIVTAPSDRSKDSEYMDEFWTCVKQTCKEDKDNKRSKNNLREMNRNNNNNTNNNNNNDNLNNNNNMNSSSSVTDHNIENSIDNSNNENMNNNTIIKNNVQNEDDFSSNNNNDNHVSFKKEMRIEPGDDKKKDNNKDKNKWKSLDKNKNNDNDIDHNNSQLSEELGIDPSVLSANDDGDSNTAVGEALRTAMLILSGGAVGMIAFLGAYKGSQEIMALIRPRLHVQIDNEISSGPQGPMTHNNRGVSKKECSSICGRGCAKFPFKQVEDR